MKDFKLRIVTPDGEIFSGKAISVLLHTTDGDAEFLSGHTDYFASLGTGRARIIDADKNVILGAASGGFVSVKGGEVTAAITTFEFKDKIDVERARGAKEKAEAALRDAKTDMEISVAKAKILRAINRINVANG